MRLELDVDLAEDYSHYEDDETQNRTVDAVYNLVYVKTISSVTFE